MQAADSCSRLRKKILPHISESSHPNSSSFTIRWNSVKFYLLSVDDFATITMAKWHTTVNYSSRNCFPCRHIGNVLTIASLSSYALPVTFAFQISWERPIPFVLPKHQDLLSLSHSPQKFHPLRKKLTMLACLLSGSPSRIRVFHKQLQSSSWLHGEMEQRNNTVPTSRNGKTFLFRGKSITLNYL